MENISCPLSRVVIDNMSQCTICYKDECAWWIEDKQECSVVTMAKALEKLSRKK